MKAIDLKKQEKKRGKFANSLEFRFGDVLVHPLGPSKGVPFSFFYLPGEVQPGAFREEHAITEDIQLMSLLKEEFSF